MLGASALASDASEANEQGRESRSDTEAKALAFLQSYPEVNIAHSSTTLIAHLKGVYDTLLAWDCPARVAFAGLFHSVYGTINFRRQTIPLSARPKIAAIIGSEAEELAFQFCKLDTRQFVTDLTAKVHRLGDDAASTLTEQESDLLHVFVANWLEQFPRMRAIQKARNGPFLKLVRPALCEPAVAEIDAIFDRTPQIRQVCDVRETAEDGESRQRFMVLDDFVPQPLQYRLSALMERNIWRYGWKASTTQTNHFFWHSHFAGDNGDGGEADCEVELHDRVLVAPVLELWQLIKESIGEGHVPVRVYANGHTYGCDGHVHTDAERGGHYTSLYYAHPQWDQNWGGETLFFNEARDQIRHCAFPKPGRLVHFSGTIPHAARSPARDCPALRAVIVIKSYCPPVSTGAG